MQTDGCERMKSETIDTELPIRAFSWVLAMFGTAVGAGILFLPIQVGQGSFLVMLLVAALIYPTIYLGHCFYALIPDRATDSIDHVTAVGRWLPHWLGVLLHLLFISWLLILLIAYSISLTNDIGDFFMNRQWLTGTLSNRVWLSFSILALLLILLRFARAMLVRILGGLTMFLIGLLCLVSIALIPHWDGQIAAKAFTVPTLFVMLKQFLLLFPLLALSFMFFPIVSSLVRDLRRCLPDPLKRQARLRRIIGMAVLLLMSFLLLFVVSFMLAIPKSDFLTAAEQNISAFALLGDLYKGNWLGNLGPLISVTALLTSFLGIFIGYRESLLPLLCNREKKDDGENAVSYYDNGLYCVTFIVLWGMAIANVPVMTILGDLVAPLGAVFLLIVPAGVVLFAAAFPSDRGAAARFTVASGILVVFAYFTGSIL